MPSDKEPLDWYIEVCGVCGCQLGPGIGSRTSTGRCVTEEHHSVGGVVVRVLARPPKEQDHTVQKLVERIPDHFLSNYFTTD